MARRGGDDLGHLGAGGQPAGVQPALDSDHGGGFLVLVRPNPLPPAASRKPALDRVKKKCTKSCPELSEEVRLSVSTVLPVSK